MKLEDLHRLAAYFPNPVTPDNDHLLREQLVRMGLDPDNLYQELEMSCRFVQAHRDTSFSNTVLRLHSHSFYEILYCTSSCGAEYLVGAERFRLQKGDVIIVPPGVSHRPLLPEQMHAPYTRDVLWIRPEFIELLRNTFSQVGIRQHAHRSLLRTAGTKWESIGELLRMAVQESEQRAPGWEIAATGNTVAFLAHLQQALLSADAASIPAEKPDLLDQVLAYVEENLGRKITLADTAQHFYVSSSTISHLFQQKMGVSFYRCVTQRRLITAKRLIEKRLPMEAVAEQTGFSDYSAFYRAFKQEYGISPRQYRNMQGGSAPEGI